jgi:hypothetical protein
MILCRIDDVGGRRDEAARLAFEGQVLSVHAGSGKSDRRNDTAQKDSRMAA